MRKVCFLTLALYLVITVWADTYKILQLNTTSVKIGNRSCAKGDVFSDDSVIHWTQKKQAFKAQNTKTKEIKMFIESDFNAKGCKTIKEYYVKTNRLSSRGGVSFSDFLDELQDTIYLCDSLTMEVPVRMDSLHYFYIEDSDACKKPLSFNGQKLRIDRGLFCDSITDKEIIINLLYHMPEENLSIKDSLTVVIIPWD